MDQNKFRLKVSFDESWVLSRREDEILPADKVASIISGKFNISGLSTSLTSLECVIEDPELRIVDIRCAVIDIVAGNYELHELSDAIYMTVEEVTGEPEPEKPAEKAEEKPEPEKAEMPEKKPVIDTRTASAAPKETPKKEPAIDRIRALIGAEEFKQLAEECVSVAEGLKENNIVESFVRRAYLISINEGYGLTTYLELFADLISELGLFSFSGRSRVNEVKLAPPDGKAENPFAPALSSFQSKSSSRIVCIDISEWMTKLFDKQFREFLRTIYESSGGNIVFFRVPFVEKNILHELHVGINDLLFVKSVSIVPFSNDELMQCAQNIVKEKGFTVEDGAWEVFNARVIEEKNDGRFYGINTVEKVIYEMLYIKQLSDAASGVHSKSVSREDILPLVDDASNVFTSGYEQLNELIGIDSVRDRVMEVVAQIEAATTNTGLASPCIHMRFVGNPGTGKTTVARILGKILKEKGILRNGDFFEYSGRDFCGRYVGETAPKTASMCRDAYGSVLFIDEAYSLYRSDNISSADYGREAIDTLIAEMENHRSDFMVIMAGYPDEMENLMKSNVGLKSRMPYQIEFPNYTREQLAAMFMSMVKKNFSPGEGLEAAVSSYFTGLSDEVMGSKDFSNARYVRNLFERTWGKAVLRCQMAGERCTVITTDDFGLASSEKEFKSIAGSKKKPIGFN